MPSPVGGSSVSGYIANDFASGNDFAASLQRISARANEMVSAAAPARVSPALENTAGLNFDSANYGSFSALGNDPKVNNATNMADAPAYAALDQGARMDVYNAAAGDGSSLSGRPDMVPYEYMRTDFRVDSA